MKTYVLIVSQYFPKTHKRSGDPTHFIEKIDSINCDLPFPPFDPKIHTIRANYELWLKRAKDINEGNAILSIRYWSDKPYRSKQIELCKIENIGIEKLEEPDNFVFAPIEGKPIDWEVVAKNDGLSFDDFCEWFKIRQKEPMAIIHFTEFRYTK